MITKKAKVATSKEISAFTKIKMQDTLHVEITLRGDAAEQLSMAAHMLVAISEANEISVDSVATTVLKAAKIINLMKG